MKNQNRRANNDDLAIASELDSLYRQIIDADENKRVDANSVRQHPPKNAGENNSAGLGALPDERIDAFRNLFRMIEEARRQSVNLADTSLHQEKTVGDAGTYSAEQYDGDFQLSLDDLSNLTRIGRFEIIECVGQGGYGIVYKARDTKLDRIVALKIPRLERILSETVRKRIHREAQVAACLSHPNIVPLFEVGKLGPISYIVSAYVEGHTLAEVIEGGALSPRQAAKVVSVLADAVQHAHARGVVHRDLKPANILVDTKVCNKGDPSNEDLNALPQSLQITDFGLAKFSGVTDISATSEVLGTPNYMSPEQASGDTNLGPATDIYSLGVILYCMMTGMLPFEEPSVVDLLLAIRNKDPLPPRKRNPRIPRDLEAICLKCLEKRPSLRYATANDLHQDLQRFLDHQVVQAHRVTQFTRLSRWISRNPVLAAVSAIAIVSMATGLLLFYFQWRRAEDNFAEARSNLDTAIEQRNRAEKNVARIGTTIDVMLANVSDNLRHVPRMHEMRKQILAHALNLQQQLVAEESDDPQVKLNTLRAYRRMIHIQVQLGNYADAIASSERALSIANWMETEDRFKPDVRSELSEIYYRRSEASLNIGMYLAAEENARLSYQLVKSPVIKTQSQLKLFLERMRMVGIAQQRQGRLDEAIATLHNAHQRLTQWPKAGEVDPELFECAAKLCNSLGIVYNTKGENKNAADLYDESIFYALKVTEQFPERIDLNDLAAKIKYNLANLCLNSKEYERAEEHYRTSCQMFAELSRSYPLVEQFRRSLAEATNGHAIAAKKLGKFADARQDYEHSIELFTQIIDAGSSDPYIVVAKAMTRSNLANLYMTMNENLDIANEQLQSAHRELTQLKIQQPAQASTIHSLSVVTGNLGALRRIEDDFDGARAKFQSAESLAMEAVKLNPESARYRNNLFYQLENLCDIQFASGEFEQCLDTASRIVAVAPNSQQSTTIAIGAYCKLLKQISEHDHNALTYAQSQLPAIKQEIISHLAQTVRLAVENGVDADKIKSMGAFAEIVNDSEVRSQLPDAFAK
jgi:serine/threonine protein kinase